MFLLHAEKPWVMSEFEFEAIFASLHKGQTISTFGGRKRRDQGPNVSKYRRVIVISGVLGLVVTVLIFLYADRVGEFTDTLYTAFAILCPPALVCVLLKLTGQMNDKDSFYAIWWVIGLTNAGLYAIIGAAVAALMRKPD